MMSGENREERVVSENDNTLKSIEVESDFDISYQYDFSIEDIFSRAPSPSFHNCENSYSSSDFLVKEDRVERDNQVSNLREPDCTVEDSIFCTDQLYQGVPQHRIIPGLSYQPRNMGRSCSSESRLQAIDGDGDHQVKNIPIDGNIIPLDPNFCTLILL